MHKRIILAAVFAATFALVSAHAQEKTPGYNQEIPEKIMTPDNVETRLGTLQFVDGVPTKEATKILYDNLDHSRGVEAFLKFIPIASLEGLRSGAVEIGVTNPISCSCLIN